MTEEVKKKAMHINLYGTQVDQYEQVKAFFGISNDNDLVRFLFSMEAKRIAGELPIFSQVDESRA